MFEFSNLGLPITGSQIPGWLSALSAERVIWIETSPHEAGLRFNFRSQPAVRLSRRHRSRKDVRWL